MLVFKDPPLLLLDEATSALDEKSQAVVQEAIEALMQGRTVLTIAHRLSNFRHADKIVCLKDGKAAEEGTQEELLAMGGIYAAYADISQL